MTSDSHRHIIHYRRVVMGIKDLRKCTGLSQSKFAAMFRIPKNTLQRWEIGYRTPPTYVVYMITELLKFKGYIDHEDSQ